MEETDMSTTDQEDYVSFTCDRCGETYETIPEWVVRATTEQRWQHENIATVDMACDDCYVAVSLDAGLE